jgi:hypothetical protein
MADVFPEITPVLADWIAAQRLFFVATAPLAGEGRVNCSPKGMDTLRVLGPREVAYTDVTGSGIETIAHLQENGRIVFMFCACEGPPKIVRLHGRGRALLAGTPEYDALAPMCPRYPGMRAIIRADISRVSTSCGYAVPKFDFVEQRDTLVKWTEKKGPEALIEYRRQKNARSLDGLPGLI